MKEFFRELQRRKVYVVGAAYLVVGWLLLQVAATVLPIYSVPDWVLKAFTTLLALGLPVALLLAWAYELTPQGVQRTDEARAPTSADVALEMPKGPTISVLPFRNLSQDPEQEMFAQAMTDGIVRGLTQGTGLTVIATGPLAANADPASVGQDLSVQYVLSGTVNKAGDAMRVTARLSETGRQTEIWSGNYDEALNARSLFDMQDDIREQIVATLGDFHGVIFSTATRESVNRPTDSLNAYQCLAVALAYDKNLNEENHRRARDSLERAIELDPEYDEAWSHLSWIYSDESIFGFNPRPHSMERALSAARRAIELNPANYHSHWLLARVFYFQGERERYIAAIEKSLALNASDGTTIGLIGGYLALCGEWERGIALLSKARKLNPHFPDYYHFFQAAFDLHRGDTGAARRELLHMSVHGWALSLAMTAAVCALDGDGESAARYWSDLRTLTGWTGASEARPMFVRFMPFQPELVDTIMDGLEAAQSS